MRPAGPPQQHPRRADAREDRTADATGAPSIPGYRMVRRIGQGAFGEVWLAEEVLTGMQRAIKLLPRGVTTLETSGDAGSEHATSSSGGPATDRELAGIRLYQEVAAGHPALVQIYHVGEVDGGFFYAMELADPLPRLADIPEPSSPAAPSPAAFSPDADAKYAPSTLAALIQREAPLPPRQALEITAQVLRGLQHLHAGDLVHRDVKPSNILFVNGSAKLADVGLVASLDHTLTQVGTPGYLPPEGAIDETADLYAAGIMLYEMITGYHRSKFPELPADLPARKSRVRAERRALTQTIRLANRGAHWDRRRRFESADAFLEAARSGLSWLSLPHARLLRLCMLLVLLAAAIAWAATRRICFDTVHVVEERSVLVTGPWGIMWSRSDFPAPVRQLALTDLDDDAASDLLVIVGGLESDAPRVGPALYRLQAHIGWPRLIDAWSAPLDLSKLPPWETRTPPTSCDPGVALFANLDDQPGQEIVVTVGFPGCPRRILTVSAEGRVIGEYWHYGAMGAYAAGDLDGDGAKELICVGLLNHPENAAKQELLSPAVMILNVERDGALHGQCRSTEMNPETLGSLRAYGRLNVFEYQETEPRVAFRNRPIYAVRDGAGGKPGFIEFNIADGLILKLDANLRAAPDAVRAISSRDPARAMPKAEDLWIPLWPPVGDAERGRDAERRGETP
ncbi:MAG: serine/threonine protein kinase [Phycisphaerales bacterium]|nr:serine/threonine protein kinase [Phycisphaerales bacterium]